MDPSYKFPGTPGLPLFPVSPERLNENRRPPRSPDAQQMPSSPSMPNLYGHKREYSDVQNKIKSFDAMAKEHMTERSERKHMEAALKRHQLAREEAESDSRRLKESNARLRADLEDAKMSERCVKDRLESLVAQMNRFEKMKDQTKAIYEKEVRKAKKEAYTSQSVIVRLQEELTATRSSSRIAQSTIDAERKKIKLREQATFEAQYRLAGVEEELAETLERLRIVEEERDTLKVNLDEEQLTRIAAEGRLSLPPMTDTDDVDGSTERRVSNISLTDPFVDDNTIDQAVEDLQNMTQEIKDLHEQVERNKLQASKAEDLVRFLKRECELGCCTCRRMEWMGIPPKGRPPPNFLKKISPVLRENPAGQLILEDASEPAPAVETEPRTITEPAASNDAQSESQKTEQIDPTMVHASLQTPSVDDDLFSSPTRQLDVVPRAIESQENTDLLDLDTPARTANVQEALMFSPILPSQQEHPPIDIKTFTTTTTIPIQDPAFTPSKLSREDKLEQIRARRGRARSVAAGILTPRRNMLEEGVVQRRDISAPAIRGVKLLH